MSMGYHNITLRANEIERCIGGIRQMLNTDEDMEPSERLYWIGAAFALMAISETDLPEDHIAFIAALKLHFQPEE